MPTLPWCSPLIAAAQALVYKAACRAGDGFPDATEAAQAKIFPSEMAIKVTNDARQLFGAAGYSRNRPLERMVRDARMFTIGGGTAQILRTVVASRLLGRKLPQIARWLCREDWFRVSHSRRFLAVHWDTRLPPEEATEKAGAPVAWDRC